MHFPGPCGRWALPTTLSCGARTFLHRPCEPAATARSAPNILPRYATPRVLNSSRRTFPGESWSGRGLFAGSRRTVSSKPPGREGWKLYASLVHYIHTRRHAVSIVMKWGPAVICLRADCAHARRRWFDFGRLASRIAPRAIFNSYSPRITARAWKRALRRVAAACVSAGCCAGRAGATAGGGRRRRPPLNGARGRAAGCPAAWASAARSAVAQPTTTRLPATDRSWPGDKNSAVDVQSLGQAPLPPPGEPVARDVPRAWA